MSGATLLLILGVKFLFRKSLGAAFHYYIWLILALRLCFPILPSSEFSALSAMLSLWNADSIELEVSGAAASSQNGGQIYQNPGEADNTVPDSVDYQPDGAVSPDAVSNAGSTISTYLTQNPEKLDFAVIAVYALVSSFLLIRLAAVYLASRRRLIAESRPCADPEILGRASEIRGSLGIRRDVPIMIGKKSLLFGIIKPMIVISEGELESASMILAHELTHYRWRDNYTKLLLEILRRIYWFSPFIPYAVSRINEDMELLCDERAVGKFSIRKDDYAMLLFQSVKMNGEEEIPVVTASSMSTAGKSLIRRISNLGGPKKSGWILKMTGIVLVLAIAAACLTNPILALTDSETNGIYNAYLDRMSDCGAALPEKADRMTTEGFCELLYLTLKTLKLPDEVSARLESVFGDGAWGLVEKLTAEYETYRPAAAKYLLGELTPDSLITKEQAAFLTSNLTVLLQRDSVFMDGEQQTIYVPKYLDKCEMERICADITASDGGGEESQNNIRKLNAFYVNKSRVAYDESVEKLRADGQTIADEDVEQAYRELCGIFPLTASLQIMIFDPFSSDREINLIAEYVKTSGNYAGVPLSALNCDVVPQALTEESFKTNLIGENLDQTSQKLIESSYDYDRENGSYTLKTDLSDEAYKELQFVIWRYTSYTAAQMLVDHAMFGIDTIGTIGEIVDGASDELTMVTSGIGLAPTTNVPTYKDDLSISEYASEAVYYLASTGVLRAGGSFRPKNVMTFGDTAVMLQKYACDLR